MYIINNIGPSPESSHIVQYTNKLWRCTMSSSLFDVYQALNAAPAHVLLKPRSFMLQVFVLDRLIEDDGVRGDEYGPYDKETVSEERARLEREKVLAQCCKTQSNAME